MAELLRGDFRKVEYREEVFQRFYQFHLAHASHPGGVYYLLRYLKAVRNWSEEEALWFAFLNGCTQHPPTSLLLFDAAPSLSKRDALLRFFYDNAPRLAFDTDRRHQKFQLEAAVEGYAALVRKAGSQKGLWDFAGMGGWKGYWHFASLIPTFGRLSAFSFLEYLSLMGVPVECEDLMLEDMNGSKSHRNGLCKVMGLDNMDWHKDNPDFPGSYPPELLSLLNREAGRLLREAQLRSHGTPWRKDTNLFTLESTLCTFKGWFRKNRRYPNVYNDMLYDRLKNVEKSWGPEAVEIFWNARRVYLPNHLRLEDMPYDPGLSPVKQNWFRETGEVPLLFYDDPALRSGFDDKVAAGAFGRRKK